MNNTENNILIAEFMGWKVQKDPTERFFGMLKSDIGTWYKEINLHYHHSWDWLMPVVEKIVNTFENSAFEFTYRVQWCEIRMNSQLAMVRDYDFTAIEEDGGIEGAYSACIKFIKWYNENKTNH